MESLVVYISVALGFFSLVGIFMKIGETKRDIKQNTEDINRFKLELLKINDLHFKFQGLSDKVDKNYELTNVRFDNILDKISNGYKDIISRLDRKEQEDRVAREEAEGARMRSMETHQEISENMKLQTKLTQRTLESCGIIKPPT